jgi:hypothetical protein
MIVIVLLVLAWTAVPAAAQQRYEVGGQVAIARSGEFEATDTGVGGRFAWHPVDLVGVEAEVNVYPGSFPGASGFSRRRMEGLFGVTAGPRVGPMRLLARVRPGFLTFHARPTLCILIFPPPLSCQLGERTVFALDLGGGVELFAGSRTFVRIDAGDRMLKYPGPSFRNGRTTSGSFFSHDFRLSAGAGLTF